MWRVLLQKKKSVIVQRFYYSAVGTVKKVWFASSTRFSNYDLNGQVPNEVSTTDKVEESLWENSFLQSRGADPSPPPQWANLGGEAT